MSAIQHITAHDCRHLVQLFDHAFIARERTCLVMGAAEPEYIPAETSDSLHRILFTRDYFASALHEVAHWCVAGPARRRRRDYGYWYSPDGRSRQEQALFEQVEVKPQALEWLFSAAAGHRFRVSADNLALGEGPSDTFKDAIYRRVQDHCRLGVNPRTRTFLGALISFYRTAHSVEELLRSQHFARSSL